MGTGDAWKMSLPYIQVCCEPITALKIKSNVFKRHTYYSHSACGPEVWAQSGSAGFLASGLRRLN